MGFQIPPLQPVLFAGAGFIGAGALESILTTAPVNADGTAGTPIIPATITGSSIGKYAVRVGCVIATSLLARMALGGERAKQVAVGGGVYVLTTAIKEFAPGVVPGLQAYRPLAGVRAYRPLAAPRVQLGGPRVVGMGEMQERFRRF